MQKIICSLRTEEAEVEEIRRRIKVAAGNENRPMNQFCLDAVLAAVRASESKTRLQARFYRHEEAVSHLS